jgi:hypothetical protein
MLKNLQILVLEYCASLYFSHATKDLMGGAVLLLFNSQYLWNVRVIMTGGCLPHSELVIIEPKSENGSNANISCGQPPATE